MKPPTLPRDRAWLIEAARAAFADIGAGTSMEEIARSAGVGTDIFYRHFRDRDELIVAVLDDLVGSLREDEDRLTVAEAPTQRLPLKLAVAPMSVVAALLPLSAVPAAATASEPPPATVLTLSPLWPVVPLNGALQGSLCESDTCVSLHYLPFWTAGGVNMLEDRLAATPLARTTANDATVVFGYSHGAMVAAEWLGEHADDPDAPSADQLSFVLIANPTRAHGGTLPAMPATQYKVIDVVRQYDPVADYPDNPFNLLAMINIGAGMLSPIHLDYTRVDIDDPANIVWTAGNTTYVFVPTANLPLLSPLRLIGLGWLADALNAPLKEIVEQAYDRPYLTTRETIPPVQPAPETLAPVAKAAIAEQDSGDTISDRPAATEKAGKRRGQELDTSAAGDATAPESLVNGDATEESTAATDLADTDESKPADEAKAAQPPCTDNASNEAGNTQQRDTSNTSDTESG